MSISIHVIADYNPESELHRATQAALVHAADALQTTIDARWIAPVDLEDNANLQELRQSNALWIGPGSPYSSLQGALSAIRLSRECRIPLLGTCGGFQHVLLEYARNVMGIEDAQHAEYDPYASRLFISQLDCSLVGRTLTIHLEPTSLAAKAYGADQINETYYCNFGVNPEYVSLLSRCGLRIAGSDAEGEVRVVELSEHPFFVATLFVPQTSSTAGQPHPLVNAFVKSALQSCQG